MVGVLACLHGTVSAREYRFDPALLDGGGSGVDLALIERGGQLPGTYTVDIQLNGQLMSTQAVVFRPGPDKGGKATLLPCLTTEQLSRYGVRVEDFYARQHTGTGECAELSVIPQATTDFNFSAQTLNLLVPQAFLRPQVKGIAPEAQWDDGVPALLLNWQANSSRTETKGAIQQSSNAFWAQLQPGANMGSWRLRNAITWQKNGHGSGKLQALYTYAERGLNGMKSRLTLGERSTSSDIFDGVPFSGVMLNSDEGMVPSGMSAYAPVVRGIARTQARVEVRQNGYSLYSGLVAPGPFALTDLNAGSSGGNLEVTVIETDGSRQVFTVPFQTPAIALHEGYLKYSLMAGRYRPGGRGVERPMVYQGTAMYGLPWNLTAYTGAQVAERYLSTALGIGLSMGAWGAVSLDGSLMHGQRRNEASERGQAWRVRYSKEVQSTDTTFTLASYQNASPGYGTLSEVLDTWRDGGTTEGSNSRRKHQSSLSINQSFGALGTLNLSGTRQTYWNRTDHTNSLNAAFSRSFGNVSVSLNWAENLSRRNDGSQKNDRVASVWFSVPLDRLLGGNMNASYRLTSPSGTGSSDTHEVGLNGRAMDRRLSWDVRQRYIPDSGSGSNSAVRLSWSGTYGQLGGNYSYSSNMTQAGLDASGGVVVHPEGLTFGQPLGDTIALVGAPGASGVGVNGWPGVRTDWRGYTTLANLNPYQENTVTLNPAEMPQDADTTQTDIRVVPTKGAVMPARFNTRIGGKALMILLRNDGTAVPYGALASLDGQGGGAGVVGDGGQVYLTGLPDQGRLSIRWTGGQCHVIYTLPATRGSAGLYEMREACR
ncbi:TPA: fimbria/pilus outer membrane usher protein [Serratia marcescens]